MEMKRINGGKLRALGYEPGTRTLQVEMDNGAVVQYAGVSQEMFRRLNSSGSPWSYFRDNIEEEYPAKRIR